MPVTAGTAQNYKRARVKMRDIQGQSVPITWYLVNSGVETDAQMLTAFTTFLNDLEAVSGAIVEEASFDNVSEIPFTSNSSPKSAQYATIDQVMALNFQRANPLKPSGVINKTFPIPAYTVGTASLAFPNAGVPNTAQPNMATIIAFLSNRLAFRYSGDGLIYTGLTFVAGDSAGVSLPDVVNNS